MLESDKDPKVIQNLNTQERVKIQDYVDEFKNDLQDNMQDIHSLESNEKMEILFGEKRPNIKPISSNSQTKNQSVPLKNSKLTGYKITRAKTHL